MRIWLAWRFWKRFGASPFLIRYRFIIYIYMWWHVTGFRGARLPENKIKLVMLLQLWMFSLILPNLQLTLATTCNIFFVPKPKYWCIDALYLGNSCANEIHRCPSLLKSFLFKFIIYSGINNWMIFFFFEVEPMII